MTTTTSSSTDQLSEGDEAQLRAVVADIAGSFGHEYFARISETGHKANELWDALAAHGFVGANIAEEFGGGSRGLRALSAVAEETAAAGCPLIMLIISPAIAGSVLSAHGDEEQKHRWLTPIGTGTGKIAFAVTEPDAGSNTHRTATTARREGDRYVLNGTKVYISGLDEAQAVLVVARTGTDHATGRGELSLFVVDADAPGLTRTPIPMNLTMPDTQFTVFFDDVEVTADRLVGPEGHGLRAVFAGLNPERVVIASICNGIGRYAVRKAVSYARERSVWGTPIGGHQGLAHPLAEAHVRLEAARLMTARAAQQWDDDARDAAEASNMAKLLAADAGVRCLEQAIAVHGGSGFTRDLGLADLLTLARLFTTAPISREMILNHVAEHTLGLPRSY